MDPRKIRTIQWSISCCLLTCACAVRSHETNLPQTPLVEILNARQPLPGILTGGQPTREQLMRAAELGYRTIVNTRTLSEEGAWDERALVEDLGMRFVHIPMAGAKGLTERNARELSDVLGAVENYPVMIHCASGNRVGALLALKAGWLDGASVEEAMDLGLDAGLTRLEEATRQALENRE